MNLHEIVNMNKNIAVTKTCGKESCYSYYSHVFEGKGRN